VPAENPLPSGLRLQAIAPRGLPLAAR
jgi:hypothetical protein